MMQRSLFVGAAVAAILMVGASVQAAPTLTLRLILQDTANVSLTPSSTSALNDTYTVSGSGTYRVLVQALISDPNQTDANHVDDTDPENPVAAPSINLGIQQLAFNISSTGTGGAAPLSNGAAPAKWASTGTTLATRLVLPPSLAPAAGVQIINLDADGDLEVVGAGFSNPGALTNGYGPDQSTGNSGFITGLQNGLQSGTHAPNPSPQIDVIRGGYALTLSGSDFIVLGFSDVSARYLLDPAAADNSLDAVAFAAQDITLRTITIQVPEPGTIGMCALASIEILGFRRRKIA